jgi:hypothetical protein
VGTGVVVLAAALAWRRGGSLHRGRADRTGPTAVQRGYTEGYAIPPTQEDGDTHLEWVHETTAALRERWTQTVD